MRMYLHANDDVIAFGGYNLCGLTDIYVINITRERFKFGLVPEREIISTYKNV